MSDANTPLTPAGRLLMIQRIEAGMPQAHVARQMDLSRITVAKWWRRWCAEGAAGLVDSSSRPHRCPRRTQERLEERICPLRRSTRRGPVYLSARTGVPASTVWRILQRNGLNRLACIDRPAGRVIRRYERTAPGELAHLDVKKVGRIPPGGGWRIDGRGSPAAERKRRPAGYTYLHVAIDDYARVAYVEAHDDETAATLVGFWRGAQDWFWANDILSQSNRNCRERRVYGHAESRASPSLHAKFGAPSSHHHRLALSNPTEQPNRTVNSRSVPPQIMPRGCDRS